MRIVRVFLTKMVGDIVFVRKGEEYIKNSGQVYKLTGDVLKTANNDYLYSAQSIKRISPFLASVSCIASAAEIQ